MRIKNQWLRCRAATNSPTRQVTMGRLPRSNPCCLQRWQRCRPQKSQCAVCNAETQKREYIAPFGLSYFSFMIEALAQHLKLVLDVWVLITMFLFASISMFKAFHSTWTNNLPSGHFCNPGEIKYWRYSWRCPYCYFSTNEGKGKAYTMYVLFVRGYQQQLPQLSKLSAKDVCNVQGVARGSGEAQEIIPCPNHIVSTNP